MLNVTRYRKHLTDSKSYDAVCVGTPSAGLQAAPEHEKQLHTSPPTHRRNEITTAMLNRRMRSRLLAVVIFFGGLYLIFSKLTHETNLDSAQLDRRDDNHEKRSLLNKLNTHRDAGRDKDAPVAGNDVKDNVNEVNAEEDVPELDVEPSKIRAKLMAAAGSVEGEEQRTMDYHAIWQAADKAITIKELWPESPEVDRMLRALRTARIVHVDVLDIGYYESGTSEKWLAMLEGGQRAMMKVVWERKGLMKPGALCNYGFEMASSEVAGFHLQRILGMRNTPYVAGRKVDIRRELLPVATPTVAKQIILRPGRETCVKGKCFHCEREHTVCPADGILEVSMAYWIPRHLKLYTFPPKYMPFSTPNGDEWEKYGFNDKTYCKALRPKFYPYERDRFYYDLFDFAVLDTLMYHYDSKHYMVHDNSDAHGLTVRLDHGRSFCANDRDDVNIFMVPLIQCCTMRLKTWNTLKSLQPGDLSRRLREALNKDAIAPVLEEKWYDVMERRLAKIKENMEKCAKANGGFHKILMDID